MASKLIAEESGLIIQSQKELTLQLQEFILENQHQKEEANVPLPPIIDVVAVDIPDRVPDLTLHVTIEMSLQYKAVVLLLLHLMYI